MLEGEIALIGRDHRRHPLVAHRQDVRRQAPGVGEAGPVERVAPGRQDRLGLAGDGRAPVDHGAEDVEGEGFDFHPQELARAGRGGQLMSAALRYAGRASRRST